MNDKTNKRRTFQILISVDETKLRSQRQEDESFSIKEAIQNEFGWLNQSGIYLEKIWQEKIKKK